MSAVLYRTEDATSEISSLRSGADVLQEAGEDIRLGEVIDLSLRLVEDVAVKRTLSVQVGPADRISLKLARAHVAKQNTAAEGT